MKSVFKKYLSNTPKYTNQIQIQIQIFHLVGFQIQIQIQIFAYLNTNTNTYLTPALGGTMTLCMSWSVLPSLCTLSIEVMRKIRCWLPCIPWGAKPCPPNQIFGDHFFGFAPANCPPPTIKYFLHLEYVPLGNLVALYVSWLDSMHSVH